MIGVILVKDESTAVPVMEEDQIVMRKWLSVEDAMEDIPELLRGMAESIMFIDIHSLEVVEVI